jgi:hypothetical protein
VASAHRTFAWRSRGVTEREAGPSRCPSR